MYAWLIGVNWITPYIFGRVRFNKFFYSYLSIPVILQAISLFCIFAQIKVEKMVIIKIISWLSSLTFGVYLCHQK